MDKFGKSQPVTRREDTRFITGLGQYVDDTAPSGSLFAFVVRSMQAHGTINDLDVEEARTMPGVALVLTAQDLDDAGMSATMQASLVDNRDGTKGANPDRPLLAKHKVRYVGEPVAMVVADTLQNARAAAEAIWLDVDDLDAHVALQTGGAELHIEATDNQAFDFGLGDDTGVDEALKTAAHVIKLDVADNRIIVNSMEPRGCWAETDGDRVHLSFGGQGVWGMKSRLARYLDMPEDQIRVTNPDVGGGFGMKAMEYPEYALVTHAARVLDQPVRWMSDRSEGMISDNAGRDLTTKATLGFDADHKIVGYRCETVANLGAYNSQYAQPIQTLLFSKVLTGVYDIPAAFMQCTGIYTNTTPVDAYRGAGRPEAIYVLERAMDNAARVLGVDGIALRRKNFITPDQMPYPVVSGSSYDVGDFERVLDRGLVEADVDGFHSRRTQSAAAGKLRGLGVCYYIESILGAPVEHARVVMGTDGVTIYVGTQSNGQGHETVYAQYFADITGVDADQITIVQGDSDLIPEGGGTGGSRSVTIQGSAILQTTGDMIENFRAFLSDQEGADVSFDGEVFRIEGSNITLGLVDAADRARGAGRDDLNDHRAKARQDDKAFPNGVHFAEVEIDPKTGQTTVQKYAVTDDFGNLINPMLVEGQIHGGVAQGLGQALMEQTVYDDDGQLLTGSFMDYAMPRAADMPNIKFTNEVIPTARNPLGMKGCGEAGTIGALAAIANAARDAMADQGVTQVDMPLTPLRVWTMLQTAKGA